MNEIFAFSLSTFSLIIYIYIYLSFAPEFSLIQHKIHLIFWFSFDF